MKLKAIFCMGIFVFSSSSLSNEKSIEECAKIEDPAVRLKCYDNIFLSSAPQDMNETPPSMEKAASDKLHRFSARTLMCVCAAPDLAGVRAPLETHGKKRNI